MYHNSIDIYTSAGYMLRYILMELCRCGSVSYTHLCPTPSAIRPSVRIPGSQAILLPTKSGSTEASYKCSKLIAAVIHNFLFFHIILHSADAMRRYDSLAVSYTHLDVYKRQRYSVAYIRQMYKCQCCCGTCCIRRKWYSCCVSFKSIKIDVYKRQVLV